jgi:hypothetical protein
MPLPKPNKGETTKDFTDRCMGDDVMLADYPKSRQRYAVCMSEAERAGRKVPPPKKGK